MDDLREGLARFKHKDTTVQADREKAYDLSVRMLQAFVKKNSDKPLSKRTTVTRKRKKTTTATTDTATTDSDTSTETTTPPLKLRGSAPVNEEDEFEEIITEGVYDKHTRTVDAERVVSALLASGKTFDDDFMQHLDKFAKVNHVSDKRLEKIKKSYEAVEEEATIGPRGYNTRLNRLRGLIESTNPREADIKRERKAISSMSDAISNSVEALERGIKAAKQELLIVPELRWYKVTLKL